MIVTRFAPSPTGYLHIGGLRTALYNYLWAKKNGGEFLLRIEDTDLKRNSKEAVVAIEKAFSWVGLNHDREVIYQSKRFNIYKKYINKLLSDKKAYYCYAPKEELDTMREEQQAKKQRPRYDGRYRDFQGTPPRDIKPVVRIKSPLNTVIEFEDGIKGMVSFNSDDILDDFIIARGDGTPTYNFVVAIDDYMMGLSDIIRGDDHLSNTPKQIVVYQALGFDIPKFYHIPMILNPQGKKLSKRDGATDVMEYKSLGILPEALLNFLVRLGWSHSDQEIFSMNEMLDLFDPSDINRSASAYNVDKLTWINTHYIKTLPTSRLIDEIKFFNVDISSHPQKELLIDSLRERAKSIAQLSNMVESIVNRPDDYDQKALKKFIKDDSLDILDKFIEYIASKDISNSDKLQSVTQEFLEEYNLKLGQLAQPVRIAITGTPVSPSIYDTVVIIGIKELKQRVENLTRYLTNSC
jgi:glutamyl-tRNA synthetase